MRSGSEMTGGSAEGLAYVSVSRFVGMARVLGEGRLVGRDFSSEMWGQIVLGPQVSEVGRFSGASEIGLKAVRIAGTGLDRLFLFF